MVQYNMVPGTWMEYLQDSSDNGWPKKMFFFFMVASVLFYFLHAILFLEHTIF